MEYLEFLTLSLQRISDLFRSTTQQNIALRVGIAAHRHQLRHGQFPSTLAEFDPDLLAVSPIDAFTGNDLLYILTETDAGIGPVVYSVGEDHQDNAGTQAWSTIEHERFISKTEMDTVILRSVKLPEWLTKDQALTKYPPDSAQSTNQSWGDWILFPIPSNDPEPLDFDYNDLTNEYFIDEQTEW